MKSPKVISDEKLKEFLSDLKGMHKLIEEKIDPEEVYNTAYSIDGKWKV